MTADTGAGPDTGRLWPSVLVGWTIAAIVLTLAMARDIAGLWFPDPDDAMRLNEVRDLLAGQSWWDVGQHRLWGGAFAMHWSRLVDLPLALVIAPLDPLIGPQAANRVALTLVPLLTLLAVMAAAVATTRILAGTERARSAILLAPLSVPLVYQLRPMRIDHHGWQVALAMCAVLALVSRPGWRSGLALGAALAALVTVSLEGLPIAGAILGVAALGWALDPARREQLLGAAGAFLGITLLLHLATRGPGFWLPACDAIAPVWLAAFATGVVGIGLSTTLGRAPLAIRIAALAASGGAAIAVLVLAAPQCLAGPFSTLDPLSRTLWYQNVSEGLPVWQQVPSWAVMTIAFPIFGLGGTILALRAATGAARARWAMMLAVASLAFALSLLIMRSGATANALVIPGGAWALHAMLTRARAVHSVWGRTLATAGALAAAAPGVVAGMILPAAPTGAASSFVAQTAPQRPSCFKGHQIADLAVLPPAVIFAPLDVSPELLATTRHSAVGSGYHRNPQAIRRVLATFLAPPEQARASVFASGADYVAACPGVNETDLYISAAPNGFWARLERGERFDWLEPVPIPGSPVLAWRVLRPLPEPAARP